MQAVAAEFSGYARKIPLLFGEKSSKHFVSIHLFPKPALRQTRSVCLRAPHGRARVKIDQEAVARRLHTGKVFYAEDRATTGTVSVCSVLKEQSETLRLRSTTRSFREARFKIKESKQTVFKLSL